MNADVGPPGDAADLRKQAEEVATKRAPLSLEASEDLPPEAMKRLLHELQVHQIELEMQNEELRRMQVELDATLKRYFDLYNMAPVGFVTVSESGLILEANPTATGMLGVLRGSLVNQPLSQFILTEDQDLYYLHRKHLFETGEQEAWDVRMVQKDRTLFWVHMQARITKDTGEAPLCRLVMSDITKRKQAENALYQEKTFTRALLENQIEGVVACNESGDLVLFNRTLVNWHGMDALKLPQEQWAEHYDLFEEDGTTPLATYAIPLVRAFKGEVINDVGMVICANKQPPRHVLCTGAPILDETHQKLGAVVVMHDITQQRENEELLQDTMQRLELATTSARMGVWDWDLLSGSMTWDDRMFELYGASHGEIQGTVQDWKDGLHPEDMNHAIAECESALRGEAPFDTEFRVKHGNGTILWIKANAVVLRDQQGNPVRMIGLNQDITERHKVQEQVRSLSRDLEKRVEERTAQLEYANKEMEAFSYSVSHDLRAPLQSIKGFSEVLLEEYWNQLDDKGKHYLQRIQASTQRMGTLITDLLKLSKTNRSELTLANCDLSRLSSEIANGLTMANPSCRVEINIQPGMMVKADHHLMQVVLDNFLCNAWKFTSKGQAPRIEVGEVVSPGGERTFFIRDNGAGFDMAHVDKLFNAFQRLHSSSDFEGTGIGLAIVQRIINRHGGRVWAEGKVGKGATFFFTIPERADK